MVQSNEEISNNNDDETGWTSKLRATGSKWPRDDFKIELFSLGPVSSGTLLSKIKPCMFKYSLDKVKPQTAIKSAITSWGFVSKFQTLKFKVLFSL